MTKVSNSAAPTRKATKRTARDPAKYSASGIAGQLPAAEGVRFRRAQEIVNGFDLPHR